MTDDEIVEQVALAIAKKIMITGPNGETVHHTWTEGAARAAIDAHKAALAETGFVIVPKEPITQPPELETIRQAIREIMFCVNVGADWFTGGREGMKAHAEKWEKIGFAAVDALLLRKPSADR